MRATPERDLQRSRRPGNIGTSLPCVATSRSVVRVSPPGFWRSPTKPNNDFTGATGVWCFGVSGPPWRRRRSHASSQVSSGRSFKDQRFGVRTWRPSRHVLWVSIELSLGIGGRRRRMSTGTTWGIRESFLRQELQGSGSALSDCALLSTKHGHGGSAPAGVTHEYESGSSSKRPGSSAASVSRDPTKRSQHEKA